MVYAALAAAAVGQSLGLSGSEIQRGIAAYIPVSGRSRIVDTGRIRIIDDCYNANPTSTASAIASIAAQSGRRVCILGDMLDLGEESPELHRGIGRLAAGYGIELVLTSGQLSRYTANGAGAAARHFESREELIAALPELIRPGDTVLVKASHSMHFEEICRALEQLSSVL